MRRRASELIFFSLATVCALVANPHSADAEQNVTVKVPVNITHLLSSVAQVNLFCRISNAPNCLIGCMGYDEIFVPVDQGVVSGTFTFHLVNTHPQQATHYTCGFRLVESCAAQNCANNPPSNTSADEWRHYDTTEAFVGMVTGPIDPQVQDFGAPSGFVPTPSPAPDAISE